MPAISKLVSIFVSVVLANVALTVPASGSEWGCQVLLCASSSNPSWRSFSACHPPMTRLISAMKKPGFDWPTCPEAGTGSPGFERYEACPAGYQVGSRRNRDGFTNDRDLCVKTVNICERDGHGLYNFDRQRSCMKTVSISRPLRSEPYYFDIRNDSSGQSERHWFGLNK